MKPRRRRKLISFQEENLSIECTPPRNPTNSKEQEELDKIEEHEDTSNVDWKDGKLVSNLST